MDLLEKRRRIMSRVAHEVEFTALTGVEVGLYAKQTTGLTISPELCASITKQAEGDFRIVRNIMLSLEKSARAQDTNTVSGDMLKTVFASTLRSRR